MKILVTGGAGFIGSHLVDALIAQGHEVTIFDSLEKQVHGPSQKIPSYLNAKAKFILGDVCDVTALDTALEGQDVVYHQAAKVGVGQSMYEIMDYMRINTMGTATLLELIVKKHRSHIKKVIVASSMSIYGEGAYLNSHDEKIFPEPRSLEQMQKQIWEYEDKEKGAFLKPIGTDENKPLHATSIYSISKKDQEEMVLNIGIHYDLPVVALRYFNVFGPRQSLSNPYTGVCAIFSSMIKNGEGPLVFEDGLQTRDFVSVHDIVQANLLALKEEANYQVFNVGTGRAISILEVAQTLQNLYGTSYDIRLANQYRSGDIRHCFADIQKVQSTLGYAPRVSLEAGFQELVSWGKEETAVNHNNQAKEELELMGLVK